MGLSVQAIKSLLSRARVNLKEILTPYIEQGTRPEDAQRAQPHRANGDDGVTDDETEGH
jgi:RNA polymerase sigma-70 factor (ECF subfamily)